MDRKNIVKKIENYSLYIGFAAIFLAYLHPVFGYISTGAFVVTYITALIKQYQKNGKIELVSFLLCTASISWVIARQFSRSPYVILAGQIILYLYLMNSQKILLGAVKKSFAAYAVAAVGVGLMRIYYPSTVTNVLNVVMQIWIIYRFMDPVLENIALKHRAKRLEAEALRKKQEEEQAQEEETAGRNTSWQIESIQA